MNIEITNSQFGYLLLISTSVGVGCIAPDEETLVLPKSFVHFSFIYRELKGPLYNYCH